MRTFCVHIPAKCKVQKESDVICVILSHNTRHSAVLLYINVIYVTN